MVLRAKARARFGERTVLGSTLQSLKRGRPTEIRWLNGAIVDAGRRAGVATRANRAIVEAVERVEKGGSFASPRELLAASRGE
jgi:2-dehydropantoate 2-reductase